MFKNFHQWLIGKARFAFQFARRWLNKPKHLVLTVGVLFCYFWFSGFLTQFPHNKSVWLAAGGYASGMTMRFPSLNPLICLWTVLISENRAMGLFMAGILMVVFGLLFYMRFNDPEAIYDEERNFYYSKHGLYGTAGWMPKDRIGLVLDVTPEIHVEKIRGDILGADEDNNIFSVPIDSHMNRHVAVFGASGTMKSRAYSRNKIIVSALRGESLVITDPKGELLEDTAEYLRKKGYEIRILNLVNPELSNGWNFLLEIEREGDIMAQTIANIIIQNTGGPKPDHFWDSAEMNLLKALMLYVAENSKITTNMPKAYEMLTKFDRIEDLTALFNGPSVSPAALQPYNLFLKAAENVRGNVMIGLGSRLQVFQNKSICQMASRDEIDLEAPAKRKCAYFCILSDTDSSLNFISSLFFSMLFIKLVKYVDTECKGLRKGTNIPVNFVLDEFPNIGLIPDFTKKISTIRSRNLNVSVIFQNLTQLENRYPDGQWEEILGNCDVQLFLGCTDLTTAEYISKRSGVVSVLSDTKAKDWNEMSAVEYQPHYRESKTIGKRYLLNPDEVLTLPIDQCLIILRGQKLMKAHKFDYTRHPQSKKFEQIEILKYNPIQAGGEEKQERGAAVPAPEQQEPQHTTGPQSVSPVPEQDHIPNQLQTKKADDSPIGNNSCCDNAGEGENKKTPREQCGRQRAGETQKGFVEVNGKYRDAPPPPIAPNCRIDLGKTVSSKAKENQNKPDIRKKQ